MHLHGLNIPDLFLSLWRGTMQCDPEDDKGTWDWMVLIDEVWSKHGEDVARATQYLPGCFDKPPRNPAERMNSGYKAQEYITWLYVLGPALLRGILPDKFWKHFCKLVRALRLIWERKQPREHLLEAHRLLCEAEEEFEKLYYQRKSSRLHFCRQSIHALLHIVPEIIRVGPGGYRSQWTLERTIGNIGEEIKQHSNAYANLAQRGKRRCQVNALKAMLPSLDSSRKGPPQGALDLQNGYILSPARDEFVQTVEGAYGKAISQYLEEEEGQTANEGWKPAVRRWARLELPNGQVLRSLWKESKMDELRIARNIKVQIYGDILYAEVQFFFQAAIQKTNEEHTLALVSVYSAPDPELLQESFQTVAQCEYCGEESLEIINITQIQSGVAMIPIGEEEEGMHFVGEKLGLDIESMGGAREEMDEDP
ncbi:hypothetical protein DFH07DRAFT_751153 [Mycena maculata]|uniref:Uncharacterized protein n=1 Tax=Mycena maculata TaxID=230809 RepID=A0AAD7N164_9AGAR|nr:hypothetical protein DFH07DRAFT_751153 [Mycena maculata]